MSLNHYMGEASLGESGSPGVPLSLCPTCSDTTIVVGVDRAACAPADWLQVSEHNPTWQKESIFW